MENKTPEKYSGTGVVIIYQIQNGKYTFQYIENFRKNTNKYFSDKEGHEKIGDRFVTGFTDINLAGLEKVTSFVKGLDPKKRLESWDINLNEILGE